mmetsp:Transcript_1080/g.1973  ORF Transcript_1080/g.1973 Transcript_1080/m.1973 type:complete len:104 (-) Transcript_1080:423-734(-)
MSPLSNLSSSLTRSVHVSHGKNSREGKVITEIHQPIIRLIMPYFLIHPSLKQPKELMQIINNQSSPKKHLSAFLFDKMCFPKSPRSANSLFPPSHFSRIHHFT